MNPNPFCYLVWGLHRVIKDLNQQPNDYLVVKYGVVKLQALNLSHSSKGRISHPRMHKLQNLHPCKLNVGTSKE